MDVDAGTMDDSRYVPKNLTHETRNVAKEQRRGGLNPLTEAERAELMAKRACFRCRKPGHMSRDCYSRRGPEKVNTGKTAPAPEPPSREPGPQKTNLEKGIEGLHYLMANGTEADKEAFIDRCQDF